MKRLIGYAILLSFKMAAIKKGRKKALGWLVKEANHFTNKKRATAQPRA